MKTLLRVSLISVLTLVVYAQTPSEFNAAYWASRPPAVQALESLERESPARLEAALALAKAGVSVDELIEARGLGNPYDTMRLRQAYGITWQQPFPQPNPWNLPPGITGMPGVPFDPNNPPPGALKTSTKIEDFRPYEPEVKPVVPTPAELAKPDFSKPAGDGKFMVLAGDVSPNGTTFKAPQYGDWIKVVRQSPFGFVAWWERKP